MKKQMMMYMIFLCSSSMSPSLYCAMQQSPMEGMERCAKLNPDEHQFAFGLSKENKKLFCEKFTPVQRAAAMQLTSQPDPTGALLSPDDAVVRVAMANQLIPNSSSQSACPKKQ